jgi:hypothetical protein
VPLTKPLFAAIVSWRFIATPQRRILDAILAAQVYDVATAMLQDIEGWARLFRAKKAARAPLEACRAPVEIEKMNRRQTPHVVLSRRSTAVQC